MGGRIRELWEYRELFVFLFWRDLIVRYRQTVIGVTWVLLRPTLTMLIFTAIFGRLAELPSHGVPYSLFVLCAIIPWQLFSSVVASCSDSLVLNVRLLLHVYFPRILTPLSTASINIIDFVISLGLLFLLMYAYSQSPSPRVILLPVFAVHAFALAFACGLWLCALTVKFRDFRFIVPFFMQVGLLISPVAYGTEIVPERWRLLFSLNPMVGVINGFRWAVFPGVPSLNLISYFISILVTAAILISGVRYFERFERQIADIV